jgi:hypothetical protein
MKLARRKLLHLAVGGAALATVSRIATAQTYPTRPVRLIVGFPAGGVLDLFARLVMYLLELLFPERIGQVDATDFRADVRGGIVYFDGVIAHVPTSLSGSVTA